MQKTVIEQILDGIKAGRKAYEEEIVKISPKGDSDIKSELCRGDNLTYMSHLLESGYAGKFNLIYIDPPFFTRSSFNASITLKDAEGKKHQIHHLAYDDKFDRNLEYYIENMTVRLLMMRDLLSDSGLMWIHLDWHSSHYIKLVMDELMGEKNFINEIIWCYKSGGSGKRHFARKHDSILVYAKTSDYYLSVPQEKSYNRDYKPYRFKGVEEYRDEVGWYTMVNMKDVWNIDMVGRTSAERTGYATQKPLELMKRIVESCTKEGDLVGDFFSGSGSLLEAAESLGRHWIGCDSEQLASAMARKRLIAAGSDFSYIEQDDIKPLSGRASIKVESKEALEDGRFLYKCTLSDIVPDIETGSIQLSDRKHVDRVLIEDRLQFADYIMIDSKGRDAFNCDYVFTNPKEEMSFIADENFSAVAADVFGKEYLADIDF
jgi:site-specific DNA-methyltransferase (adenine-specific)